MTECWQRDSDGLPCDLLNGHEGEHQRCHRSGHGPTCEGRGAHIRARDKAGCAQFQDGSWITKARFVCFDDHPGLRGRKRPDYGIGDATLDMIEGGTP